METSTDETKLIPISIQQDGKYYNLVYKDGKIITEATLEVDEAAEILFREVAKRLETLK